MLEIGDAVPPRFVRRSPQPTGATCSICGVAGDRHQAAWCMICRSPAEHHDGRHQSFRDCFDGRRRMAAARRDAGVPLDEVDQLVLDVTVD